MNDRDRNRQHSLTRTALALFAVVWLNMAMQPCLMAAEPILPTGHSEDCPHCPEIAHCGDEARCTYIESYDFDGRGPSLPDSQTVFLASADVAVPVVACSQRVSFHAGSYPAGPDPGPPLYVLHCRYLK